MKKLFILMFSLVSVGAMAEESSKKEVFPRYVENEKAAVNYCRNLDLSILDSLKGAMIGQGITSGLAGAANVGSVVLTATNDDSKVGGKQIAANIMTGVGTAGSVANVAISGVQISKLNNLIDDLKACQNGLNDIPDNATMIESDKTTSLSNKKADDKSNTESDSKSEENSNK